MNETLMVSAAVGGSVPAAAAASAECRGADAGQVAVLGIGAGMVDSHNEVHN